MKELRNDFKINSFKSVYLLYGDESYLIRHYSKEFTDKLLDEAMMNCDTFEGKDVDIASVIGAAETLPFLSRRRLVFVKDSNLMVPGRKDDSDVMAKYVPKIPDTTVMVFSEANVDKRNRLYKQVASLGRAVDFKTPAESDLIKWVTNIFKKKNMDIEPQTVKFLLATVPKGMDSVYAEADKLGDYTGERRLVTVNDIKEICSKSLEARIFDLVGALCMRQTQKALLQYHNMLVMKEQPLMMLAMMARQFRLILNCKAYAEKAVPPNKIATEMGIRDFMVKECLRQGGHYSKEDLIRALMDCQDTDIRIKTGLIEGELGVELLIIKYST